MNWRRDENQIDWKVHLNLQLFTCATYNNLHKATRLLLENLRYEDGKARTGTTVDAGNFRGSRRVAKKQNP